MDGEFEPFVLGEYEVLQKLGQGGMGMVFKARHQVLGRVVALKTLNTQFAQDPAYVDRFLREARAAARLNHPNIIQLYEVKNIEGSYFIALEFVDGGSLGSFLNEYGKFPEKESVELLRQACGALAYAHAEGVIHRDIKPDNFMLTSEGTLKLCDLGLAKLTQNEDIKLTQTGTALGSPYYMSPEQIRGISDIDARTDIYSLGAMLFHMTTGTLPYTGNTASEVLARHLNDPVPSARDRVPELSAGLNQVLYRMMAKDRDKRYVSVVELDADLQKLLEGNLLPKLAKRPVAETGSVPVPETAPPPSLPPPVWGPPRSAPVLPPEPVWLQPWFALGALTLFVALIGTGAFLLLRHREAKPVTPVVTPALPPIPPVQEERRETSVTPPASSPPIPEKQPVVPAPVVGVPLPAPEENRELQVGDTEERVRAVLGAPSGVMQTSPTEKILSYDRGEITMRDGKVFLLELLPGNKTWTEISRKKKDQESVRPSAESNSPKGSPSPPPAMASEMTPAQQRFQDELKRLEAVMEQARKDMETYSAYRTKGGVSNPYDQAEKKYKDASLRYSQLKFSGHLD
ncbi:MAG: serine/threonine-protein kinase [Verrucomicrobiae bacterium]|nr:serine/threonine-protein kinase [Verrucomicrobiae bacterium]